MLLTSRDTTVRRLLCLSELVYLIPPVALSSPVRKLAPGFRFVMERRGVCLSVDSCLWLGSGFLTWLCSDDRISRASELDT
jgi:hypothetical protein